MDQIKDIISISIFAVTLATIALSLAPIVLVIASITLFKVRNIQGALKTIMSAQTEFDAKIALALEKLDGIAEAVDAEAAQIAAFIAAQPEAVDTSALDGVIERLGEVAEDVSGVFEPEVEVVEEEPVPVEEPTEKEG